MSRFQRFVGRRELRDAEIIPAWYGVAFMVYPMHMTICYPIPLNYILRWIEAIRWRVKRPTRLAAFEAAHTMADRLSKEAYERGKTAGYQEGLREAMAHQTDFIGNIMRILGACETTGRTEPL